MITHKEILDYYEYDPTTGVFQRHLKTGGMRAVGHNNKGYLEARYKNRNVKLHRLAWFYVHGEWPECQIDHINHNRSDNRMSNLRCVTIVENARNHSISTNNTSGICGVHWHKHAQMWYARIYSSGKWKSIGYYKKKEDAAIARKEAETMLGYHPNHGKTLNL